MPHSLLCASLLQVGHPETNSPGPLAPPLVKTARPRDGYASNDHIRDARLLSPGREKRTASDQGDPGPSTAHRPSRLSAIACLQPNFLGGARRGRGSESRIGAGQRRVIRRRLTPGPGTTADSANRPPATQSWDALGHGKVISVGILSLLIPACYRGRRYSSRRRAGRVPRHGRHRPPIHQHTPATHNGCATRSLRPPLGRGSPSPA